MAVDLSAAFYQFDRVVYYICNSTNTRTCCYDVSSLRYLRSCSSSTNETLCLYVHVWVLLNKGFFYFLVDCENPVFERVSE